MKDTWPWLANIMWIFNVCLSLSFISLLIHIGLLIFGKIPSLWSFILTIGIMIFSVCVSLLNDKVNPDIEKK